MPSWGYVRRDVCQFQRHHHHHQVLHSNRRNLGWSSAESRSSTANSGWLQFYLGLNRCCSFPLLSAPHSLFSIWTDLKRSQGYQPLHSGSDTQSSGKKLSSSTLTKTVVSMFIISTSIYISTSWNIKRLWQDAAAWRDLEWGWQIRINPLCTRRDFACEVWRRCESSWSAILFDFKMHILPTGMYFTFM